MSKKDKKSELKVRLKTMTTTASTFKHPQKKFDLDKYPLIEYNLNFIFNVDYDNSLVIIVITGDIEIIETKEVTLSVTEQFLFEANPISEVAKKDGKDYALPNHFLAMLLNICIGTFRGIIKEKSKGTFAEHEFLPIVTKTQIDSIVSSGKI